MSPMSPLQECYRSHHASRTGSRRLPRSTVSRMRPQSPLHERHGCRRYKNVTQATATGVLRQSPLQGILPQPSLQECYSSHCFKQITVVTASRMLPQSPLQERYSSHRSKNVAAVTVSTLVYAFGSCKCPLTHTHCLGSLAGIILGVRVCCICVFCKAYTHPLCPKVLLEEISPCENPNSHGEIQYRQTAPKTEPSIKSKSAEQKTKASFRTSLWSGGTFKFQTFTSKSTAWKAWDSSNKASGWFGAAARNLGPSSARFRIQVPFLKVQIPQGSTSRFHC